MPRYTPSAIPERDLRGWLADELRRIAASLGPRESIELAPVGVEPLRVRDGTILYAVDPWATADLNGPGIYARVNGAWVELT